MDEVKILQMYYQLSQRRIKSALVFTVVNPIPFWRARAFEAELNPANSANNRRCKHLGAWYPRRPLPKPPSLSVCSRPFHGYSRRSIGGPREEEKKHAMPRNSEWMRCNADADAEHPLVVVLVHIVKHKLQLPRVELKKKVFRPRRHVSNDASAHYRKVGSRLDSRLPILNTGGSNGAENSTIQHYSLLVCRCLCKAAGSRGYLRPRHYLRFRRPPRLWVVHPPCFVV
ncbi:hypothetical protein F4776DRAFT_535842 [Hypoxylon sp. NC0597]|nr:hypothetical protein F4776DRAFT_535842 [Hypoxylon sp. NC0597]